MAAFAAPALADQPNGIMWPFKNNTDYTKIDNLVAQGAAQIIQDGQFVAGTCGDACGGYTQLGAHGRSDVVQGVQASQGRGRDK